MALRVALRVALRRGRRRVVRLARVLGGLWGVLLVLGRGSLLRLVLRLLGLVLVVPAVRVGVGPLVLRLGVLLRRLVLLWRLVVGLALRGRGGVVLVPLGLVLLLGRRTGLWRRSRLLLGGVLVVGPVVLALRRREAVLEALGRRLVGSVLLFGLGRLLARLLGRSTRRLDPVRSLLGRRVHGQVVHGKGGGLTRGVVDVKIARNEKSYQEREQEWANGGRAGRATWVGWWTGGRGEGVLGWF